LNIFIPIKYAPNEYDTASQKVVHRGCQNIVLFAATIQNLTQSIQLRWKCAACNSMLLAPCIAIEETAQNCPVPDSLFNRILVFTPVKQ
jgi:hypothetical protein